jgi:hypothetical protein
MVVVIAVAWSMLSTLKLFAQPTETDASLDLATAQTSPTANVDHNYKLRPALPEQDDFKVVCSIPYTADMGAITFQLSGLTTRWRDGAVPSDDYVWWTELYVVTRPGNGASYTLTGTGGANMDGQVITTDAGTNPSVETMVGVTGDEGNKYQKVWTDPQPDGALYITNVINPDYTNTDPNIPYPGLRSVVYFTTKLGQTGHFDMSTGTWTFDPMKGIVDTPTAPPSYP